VESMSSVCSMESVNDKEIVYCLHASKVYRVGSCFNNIIGLHYFFLGDTKEVVLIVRY